MPRLVAVACVVLCWAAGSVFAQSGAPQAYLAFLDYAAFHQQVLARCAAEYPGTEVALGGAIAEWTKKNQSALVELRSLMHERLLRQGMSPKEAEERDRQAAAKVTSFMLNGLNSTSASELSEMCSKAYAEQLTKPEMDYAALLQRAKERQTR